MVSRVFEDLRKRKAPNRSLTKAGASNGLIFTSPSGEHLRYVVQLRFQASNNVVEFKALVIGLCIIIELGLQRLHVRGGSQLVIGQAMKESECRDPNMAAYCREVR
jgi:ribonuclease HI